MYLLTALGQAEPFPVHLKMDPKMKLAIKMVLLHESLPLTNISEHAKQQTTGFKYFTVKKVLLFSVASSQHLANECLAGFELEISLC